MWQGADRRQKGLDFEKGVNHILHKNNPEFPEKPNPPPPMEIYV